VARSMVEKRIADIIREHVVIGYEFADATGAIDSRTIRIVSTAAAASEIMHMLNVAGFRYVQAP